MIVHETDGHFKVEICHSKENVRDEESVEAIDLVFETPAIFQFSSFYRLPKRREIDESVEYQPEDEDCKGVRVPELCQVREGSRHTNDTAFTVAQHIESNNHSW